MNQLILPVKAAPLPQGFCPNNYQDILAQFASLMTVTFPNTFSGVTASTSPPTDTTQAWFQLDSLGRPTRLYYFAQGKWLSLHPQVPGSVMIWPVALPDFTVFDGGDASAPSAVSGPMWQQAQDSSGNVILAGQFPVGVGTLQPSGTAVGIGATGGEDVHTLTTSEIPVHQHFLSGHFRELTADAASDADGGVVGYTAGAAVPPLPVVQPTDNVGGGQSHNNLPPYFAVYFLQRTNRLFYSV